MGRLLLSLSYRPCLGPGEGPGLFYYGARLGVQTAGRAPGQAELALKFASNPWLLWRTSNSGQQIGLIAKAFRANMACRS
jgi:hypothetical protein